MLSGSVMSDSATPWTIAHQAPPSLGFFQASILEWVFMPSSRDLPDPEIKPMSPVSPTLQVDSLPAEPSGTWKE